MPNVSSSLRPDWTTIPQEEFRENYRQLGSLHDLASFWGVAPSQISYYAFRIGKRGAYRTLPFLGGTEGTEKSKRQSVH